MPMCDNCGYACRPTDSTYDPNVWRKPPLMICDVCFETRLDRFAYDGAPDPWACAFRERDED